MKKNLKLTIRIISVAIFLVVLQFYLSNIVSNYEGTDDQAVNLISEIAPNYTPWFHHIWEPSNERSETLLFAFQTTLGLAVLVFYFIKRTHKIKGNKCS